MQKRHSFSFENTFNLLEKRYLLSNDYSVIYDGNTLDIADFSKSIRFILIDKIVYVKDENNLDKLSSIYSALYSIDTKVILKIVSDGKQCRFYIGVNNNHSVSQKIKVLKGALDGNFPGSTYGTKGGLNNREIISLNKEVFTDKNTEITSVLGIPSLKNKEDNLFLQGLDNLILGMYGKPFSAVFIADPISQKDIGQAKKKYENIYSELSSLKEQTYNVSVNDSVAVADGVNKSVNETLGYSTSRADGTTNSNSTSNSTTKGSNSSISNGITDGDSMSKTKTPHIIKGLKNKIFGTTNKTKGTTKSTSYNKTEGNSNSGTSSISDSNSKSYTETLGENNSRSNSSGTSKTETLTSAKTYGIQYTKEDKSISNVLENLDLQFERLQIGENVGLWNVGAYFLSEYEQNSVVAANIYSGLIRGEDSRVEKSAIRTFCKGDLNYTNLFNAISSYEIPKISLSNIDYQNYYSSLLTTKEMTIKMSFPQKSVIGIDVVEVRPFGNNKRTLDSKKTINVGNLYNYEKEFDVPFDLDLEKFTGHVFVTGSTGSGKSNATFTILDKLIKKGINFLVIEPAKGEYKDVFGIRPDVNVYSTNPNYSPLLKLNPFSFPEKIHIYEHIDRLIEILNASWPMYAAMPAILKEAVIKSYEVLGWNMFKSINEFGERKFPTFKDLAKVLPKLIQDSDYSSEMKSNYSGALVTRVNSMCNGLLSLVFEGKETSSSDLFDANVIVDLSKVASSETKSLLMGFLFMKLQEHRMSSGLVHNSKLKHLTIIEEAHNLLKNTSSEQGQEGANLQGKSVEMISNAIAEMRTFGQGFLLADQAPGLLDPSAIRNTNTKICLRLPSQEDRELMGKAMMLDDMQIMQLAKLETGVAAVYQNDWQETMLCKFSYFKQEPDTLFEYVNKEEIDFIPAIKFLVEQLVARHAGGDVNIAKLEKIIKNLCYVKYKNTAGDILANRLNERMISKKLYTILAVKDAIKIINCYDSSVALDVDLRLYLRKKYKLMDRVILDTIIGLMRSYNYLPNNKTLA